MKQIEERLGRFEVFCVENLGKFSDAPPPRPRGLLDIYLVGDPYCHYKPSLATVTGGGDLPVIFAAGVSH